MVRNEVGCLLNFLILAFLALDIILFLPHTCRQSYPSLKPPIKEGTTQLRKLNFGFSNEKIDFNEILNASNYLGLSLNPSYNPLYCSQHFSELQCSEIIQAFHSIKQWNEEGSTRKDRYLLCSTNHFDFNQKIQTESVCLAIAMMTNRSLLLESQTLFQTPSIITDSHKILNILYQNNPLQIINQDSLSYGKEIDIDANLIASDDILTFAMLYLHPKLGDFCFKNFNNHAALFLSYYLYSNAFFENNLTLSNLRINFDDNIEKKNQSKNVKTYSTQVEFGRMTSNKESQVCASNIKKKLKAARLNRPISVNLVTDSVAFNKEFAKDFGEPEFSLILTSSSDIIDHFSSANVVLSGNEKIMTVQSDLSNVLSKLSFQRPFWYERDHGKFFVVSSSQSFLISPFVNNISAPQSNDLLHITEDNEINLRKIVKYFFI